MWDANNWSSACVKSSRFDVFRCDFFSSVTVGKPLDSCRCTWRPFVHLAYCIFISSCSATSSLLLASYRVNKLLVDITSSGFSSGQVSRCGLIQFGLETLTAVIKRVPATAGTYCFFCASVRVNSDSMSYFLQNGQSKKNSKLVEKYLHACKFGNEYIEDDEVPVPEPVRYFLCRQILRCPLVLLGSLCLSSGRINQFCHFIYILLNHCKLAYFTLWIWIEVTEGKSIM